MFVKTAGGWMYLCCAKAPGLERLPNTYVQPSLAQIEEVNAARIHELETMISQKRKAAIVNGNETKRLKKAALMNDKEAAKEKKKVVRIAMRLARSTDEVALAKMLRKEKLDELRLNDSLRQG
jgi:hypothetical protein